MGIFDKSLVKIIFDTLTDPKSSGLSSRKLPISTTTPTLPTGIGTGDPKILDTLEKLDTVLMDVDTEGEKRGYERAAAEYDAAYVRIENEYLTAKNLLEQLITSKDTEATRLISKLQKLEEDKRILERKVHEKTKQVSNKYNIPVSSITQSLVSGTLLIGGSGTGARSAHSS